MDEDEDNVLLLLLLMMIVVVAIVALLRVILQTILGPRPSHRSGSELDLRTPGCSFRRVSPKSCSGSGGLGWQWLLGVGRSGPQRSCAKSPTERGWLLAVRGFGSDDSVSSWIQGVRSLKS